MDPVSRSVPRPPHAVYPVCVTVFFRAIRTIPFLPSLSLKTPLCRKNHDPFSSRSGSFHVCCSLTHRSPMASVLRSLTSLFLIILIFSFIPRPTTSFPIIVLERTKDHNSLTSSSSIIIIMDGPQIFGIAFALGKPVALSISHRGPVLTYMKRGFLRYFVPGHGSRTEWPLTGLSTESFVGFFTSNTLSPL